MNLLYALLYNIGRGVFLEVLLEGVVSSISVVLIVGDLNWCWKVICDLIQKKRLYSISNKILGVKDVVETFSGR